MNYWGRIFFIYEDEKLKLVKGQPLENHVGNCADILKQFKKDYFNERTKERLLTAVKLHDQGKKETFRIMDEKEKKEKYGKKAEMKSGKKGKQETQDTAHGFSYSFSGHRFRVPGDDPYIDALIRSHHEFSVEQVNREKALLPDKEDQKRFPDDLYLLCMADQIEAELAVKTVENKKGELPRTFMEFVTRRVSDHEFNVVPWPFEPEKFILSFELWMPEIGNPAQRSAKEIQHIFEHETKFKPETIQVTLRRE
jgi:CRISPR-associated endonuclease/helicase Cas3